jgi:hypothetical protein
MRIMGRPRALFAVLAGCLLLAGCASGPSQVGAAVILDGHVVSVDEVQQLIDKSVQQQPLAQQFAQQHKLDLVGREVVHQLVIHDVLTKVAQRERLVVDDSQVTQLLKEDPLAAPLPTDGSMPPDVGAQQIVLRARDRREALTDMFLEERLAAKYLPTLSATVDYTVIQGDTGGANPATSRQQAIDKAKAFAADPDFATRSIQQDAAQAQGKNIGVKIVAAQSPLDATSPLLGAPANSVIALQPNSDSATWAVVVVRQRDVGTPVAVTQADQLTLDQITAIGQRMLQPEFGTTSLKINPRYGVWDPVAMNVAPSEATTTGVVLPFRVAAQPQQ